MQYPQFCRGVRSVAARYLNYLLWLFRNRAATERTPLQNCGLLNKYKWLLTFIYSLGFLTSCTVGPDFQSPEAPNNIEEYTRQPINANNTHIQTIKNPSIPQQWWELFHSESLNSLMNEALEHNQDFAAARATLRQAQQNYNAAAGTQFPVVDGNLSATPTQTAPAQFGFGEFPTNAFVLYNASVSVAYNLDMVGGIRRQVEAYGAQAQYQAYQMQGVKLTVSSNVSTSVFKLALLNDQLTNTQAIVNEQQALLTIANKQLGLGGINQIDVNNIHNNLLENQVNLTNIQKDREKTLNQLAIYLGKAPTQIPSMHFKLNDFSPLKNIPVIIPSELVHKRPDILAAEALLHQACAELGVATANLYPQINLTGNLGRIVTQTTWQELASDSWIWSFGPGMTLPIFNAGTLNAQKEAAIAGLENAAANYRETVLEALQNVADCLTALDLDSKNLTTQENYYNKVHQNLLIIQGQVRVGGASNSQLLDAKIADHQANIKLLEARSLKLSDTVALFQAMGGSWWNVDAKN